MPRFEQMRDRLPTLYRPSDEDSGLLTLFLRNVADVLEEVHRDASHVLQTHWFAYADRALYSPYVNRSRELQSLPPLALNEPLADNFPYISDLARLAALVSLPPWQQPPALREAVEAYRLRIQRIVALYRNGLGTTDALRRMVEAQLPVDLPRPGEARDRPFWLEEFAPLVKDSLAVQAPGEPEDMVGPLMRWTITNVGLQPTLPTLYIQGVAPQTGHVDATENPVIELYQSAGDFPRLGIAYAETIAPDKTMRLRPAYTSWIGRDNGVQSAESVPTENGTVDATAPGPWVDVGGAPAGTVVAMHQSQDKTLWVATNVGGAGELWRYDGQNWTGTLNGLPEALTLHADGPYLLIGTTTGLLRMRLYPEDDGPFAATPVSALAGQTVNAIFRAADGRWWIGTDNGAAQMETMADEEPLSLQNSDLQGTAVRAISQDQTETLYFGTALGLFQYQPTHDHWYWYAGMEHTEQQPDWEIFTPGQLPTDEQVALPPVRCVHRGPDTSLWVGTDNGIARYVARSVRGLTYETVLEAFPDLTSGPVFAIREDERGVIWFCTDGGLLRYDGRDWWQFQAGVWAHLGRADTLHDGTLDARGSWRFQRSSSQWQRFEPSSSTWVSFLGEARATVEDAARTVFWTDAMAADLGQWDGVNFTPDPDTPVNPADLRVRYKPSEPRIVDGGIPAVPRLPVGLSTWRYLSLEGGDVVEPADRPAWTIEGRLLPPPLDLAAAAPGRYGIESPPPASNFDEAVFAFRPAARVWFEWETRRPLTVLVRLKRQTPDERIDPAILDRVWQGMQQVRPAGIRTMLAVEENIVRGKENE